MGTREVLCAVFLAVMVAAPVSAQNFGALGPTGTLSALRSIGQGSDQSSPSFISVIPGRQETYVTLGLRKYINSFTSKQFPSEPWAADSFDPRSRLEFPWQQTFGVIKLGVNYYGIQASLEGAATLFVSTEPMIQDSDWTDPTNPGQKTIFSVGNNFPRCWTGDASIGYSIPGFPLVQWSLGYRIQRFHFTWMDGEERRLGDPHIDYLHGEVIQFSQSYDIGYVGGAICSALPYNLVARLGGDVGSVMGKNVDNHILRDESLRFAYMSTRGICWHANLALELRIKQFARIGVVGDFLNINSYGGHHLVYPGVDESWDGARVWSEQKFVEVNASLIF